MSGKQWEIDVEKQLISYLIQRLGYLRSLRPKAQDGLPYEAFDRIGRTLDTSQSTISSIVSDIDKNKNVVKYDD